MAVPVRSSTGDVQLSSDQSFLSTGDAVTLAFDAGSDANRMLEVAIAWDGAGSHTMPDAGVTYNGTALTALGPTINASNNRTRVYRLIAPATGSNTVSVDPSTGLDTRPAVITVRCFSNVDQTTPLENYTTSNATDNTNPYESSLTVTSGTSDRLVVVAHSVRGSGVTGGTPTNFTERSDNVNGIMGMVVGDAAGAATVATSVAWAGVFASDNVAHGYSLIGVGGATAAITGTLNSATRTQADVKAGGRTIIVTLTGDTFVASGSTFDAIRADIIAGLDAASSPATGWNTLVRDTLAVTTVVRTSATVCTITLPAIPLYAITADEVVTVTVPASALTLAAPLTATPTITVHEGVVLSAYSGTTNGSGVLAVNLTSDQSAVRTLTRAYDGATEVARVTTRPT